MQSRGRPPPPPTHTSPPPHSTLQVGLYKYIRGAPMQTGGDLRRLSITGGAHVGMLSVSMLLNGYSYFIPKLHEAHANKPLVRRLEECGVGRGGRKQCGEKGWGRGGTEG